MAKSKILKKTLKKILKSDCGLWLIGKLAYYYTRFVGFTTKWHMHGIENVEEIIKAKKSALCLAWHSRAIMLPYVWKKRYRINALVSPHQDGRIIAKLLHSYGVKTIDGSSNNNASSSALRIFRALKEPAFTTLIPDGPRGPRQKLNPSPIFFASKTQSPIICIAYSYKKSKIIERSWDRMMLPKPFSDAFLMVSKPVFIPENLDEKGFEEQRLKIENELNRLQNEVDTMAGIPIVSPDFSVKTKKYPKESK